MSEILGYDKYGRPLKAGDNVRILTMPCVLPESRGKTLAVTDKAYPPLAARLEYGDRDWVLLSDGKGIVTDVVSRIDPDQFAPAGLGFSELVKKINGRVEA